MVLVPKAEAPDRPGNSRKIRGRDWSGRLDLNQQPLVPHLLSHHDNGCEGVTRSCNCSIRRHGRFFQPSQCVTRLSRNLAANLLPQLPGGIEGLLTVREVAKLLRVCTATVYKWAAAGVLPHIRIVNVIRVQPDDFARFVAERSR